MEELVAILKEFEDKARETIGLDDFIEGPAYSADELMLAEIIANQRKLLIKENF